MLRDAGEDPSANPEAEQLLSDYVRINAPCAHATSHRIDIERWPADEARVQGGGVPSSRPTSRNKSMELSRNVQIGEAASGYSPIAAITPSPPSSSVMNDGVEENDDPPPYSVIALPNHISGWPYDFFPSGDSSYPTNAPPRYEAEIPLAPLQAAQMPSATTALHLEGTNGQHASLPIPLTPYRFFMFNCHRSYVVPRETSLLPDHGIAEKIDDRKSRRCSAILVAAAVIIFLMALSLMVRFVMERSWWRR